MKTLTIIVFCLTCLNLWGQSPLSDYKKVLLKDLFKKDTINLSDSCSIQKYCFETKLESKLYFKGTINTSKINRDTSLTKFYRVINYANNNYCNKSIIKDENLKPYRIKAEGIEIALDINVEYFKNNNLFNELQVDDKVDVFGRLVNYPKYFYDKSIKVIILHKFVIDKISKKK